MKGGALRSVIGKEFRALLPVSMAGGAAIAASTLAADDRIAAALFVFAYVATSIALGALSIGHEYAHRTLPFLLAVPIARGRLFAAKVGVLAVMLAALSVLMWVTRPWPAAASRDMVIPAAGLLFAPCCALFLSPALTMLSRSTLGGAVFTLVIPALLLIGADLAAAARFGANQPALSDAFKLQLVAGALVACCLVAAVTAPLLFRRLQAIETNVGGIGDRQWRRYGAAGVAASRRRPVLWLLLIKELRLQAMTFTLVALYLTLWLGMWAVGHADRGILPAMSTSYGLLLAILAGALSSAEERQHGTLEWQLLLPMSARRQWLVKVGVTLMVAVLVGSVLPFAVLHGDLVLPHWSSVMFVLALTAISIHVSSVVTGGVRALVVAILAIVICSGALRWLQESARVLSWIWDIDPIPLTAANVRQRLWWHAAVSSSAMGATIVTLLLFAYANHRSFAQPWRRVARQGAVVFGLMALGVLALSSLRFARFVP
ncbi:MAG TPA: hypothetical protein VE379_12205 [Vicinamibacterales bacterium]|jgi:ABC-type transport system involved in multi-copper enzyme maturation permease subunit|nr:hypothetical protein [Vicinamibacterales bacterium]